MWQICQFIAHIIEFTAWRNAASFLANKQGKIFTESDKKITISKLIFCKIKIKKTLTDKVNLTHRI